MKEQLVEKVKDKHFALQVDEATDSNKDCLLIAYVRYVDTDDLSEDLLFCNYVRNRATADELFKIIDTCLCEAEMKWQEHGEGYSRSSSVLHREQCRPTV